MVDANEDPFQAFNRFFAPEPRRGRRGARAEPPPAAPPVAAPVVVNGDDHAPEPVHVDTWPRWIGPTSFVATVLLSLRFVPIAPAFILGFAAFVLVEATMAYLRPQWYRPSTLLKPAAETSERTFQSVGQWLVVIADVGWWVPECWAFLRRILPLDALWRATLDLLQYTAHLAVSPLKVIVGIARGIHGMSNPLVSLTVILLLAASVVQWWRGGPQPWQWPQTLLQHIPDVESP